MTQTRMDLRGIGEPALSPCGLACLASASDIAARRRPTPETGTVGSERDVDSGYNSGEGDYPLLRLHA